MMKYHRQLSIFTGLILFVCVWQPCSAWEPHWNELLGRDAAAEIDAVALLDDCRLSENTASA